MLGRIDAAYSWVLRAMLGIAAAYLFLQMAAIVYVTLFRTFGWFYTPASFAFIEYGFIYIMMLGSPWLVRTRGHVFIELITGSVGVAYRDDSVLTNEGGPYPGRPGQPLLPIVQEAFSLWDASIGWLSPDAKWRFGINGKNLADKGYVTNGYNIPALGILVGSYGAPRTVLATIDYKFF